MKNSDELKQLIMQWVVDLSSGNTDITERLFSTKQAGFLAVGSAPNELKTVDLSTKLTCNRVPTMR